MAALELSLPSDTSKPGDEEFRNPTYSKLTYCIRTIPGEPAGWANRGLWYLRDNRLKEAGDDLRHAEELAPDDADIQKLLGALDEKSGKFAAALARFRKVHAKNPNDLETLHALVLVREREGGKEADAEVLAFLNEALAIQPNNVVLLYRKGVFAARLEDREALREVVARYNRQAPDWSGPTAQTARELLQQLNKEAAGRLPGDVPITLNQLDNVLKPEHFYNRDARDAGQAERLPLPSPSSSFYGYRADAHRHRHRTPS